MMNVVVTLQVEGLHHWPDCPLPEVSFLRDKHRHMFHIKAKKRIDHGGSTDQDRHVEIIMLKRKIKAFLRAEYAGDFGSMSCEQIATVVRDEFQLSSVEVLEDGENGAEVFG